jgi:ABC-type transport system substrate-binding protein
MKKIFVLLLALCMIVSVFACTPATETTAEPAATEEESKDALQQQEEGTAKLEEATTEVASEEKTYGGTFIVGIPGDPAGFMAVVSTDTYNKYAWQPMAIGLLDYDASNNMEPICSELAESYEFSDDFMHLTFHLRDAVWTDGEPITSGDVKFTIEKFLIPYSSTCVTS